MSDPDHHARTRAERLLAVSHTGSFDDRLIRREYPDIVDAWSDPMRRRRFLQIMGASLALAGLNGCIRTPQEQIVPPVQAPPGVPPTEQTLYATAMARRGFGVGLLARTVSGRPIKLEGNPQHSASLGRTDAHAQASLLGLYDPERSQNILHVSQVSTWSDFSDALQAALKETGGEGLRILTETVTSPTCAAQIAALLDRYPKAAWHQWDPRSTDNVRNGTQLSFGRYMDVVYHFDRAAVVVCHGRGSSLGCGGGRAIQESLH